MNAKGLCILLTVLALLGTAFAEESGQRRVFLEGETEPFPEGTKVLTIRVCPVMGADCTLVTLGGHSMLVAAEKEFLRNVDPEYVYFPHTSYNTQLVQKQLKRYGLRYEKMNYAPGA